MSYQGKSIVCCVSTNKKYVPSFKGLCHLKDHSNTFFNPSLKTNEPYQLKHFYMCPFATRTLLEEERK